MIDKLRLAEITRYLFNGLAATGVHYTVFMVFLMYLFPNSTGIANFIASFFGIGVSFLGSRYFVFRNWSAPIVKQLLRFGGFYIGVALLNGLILFLWTDQLHLNKTAGFLLGVAVQIMLSYVGGRRIILA